MAETINSVLNQTFPNFPLVITDDLPLAQCLAELALATNASSHLAFALETLFAAAKTDSDFARLREVTGKVNVFGFQVEPGARL